MSAITHPITQQEQELLNAEAIAAASIEKVRSMGLKLPDVVLDLSEWVTQKRYAEEHGVSIPTVSNWIGRGIIPADCVQIIPELNDLRLIKNQDYSK